MYQRLTTHCLDCTKAISNKAKRCSGCHKAWRKVYNKNLRIKNAVRNRLLSYAWRKDNKAADLESRRVFQRKYRRANPKKAYCHLALHRAVKSGRITRQLCWCGKEAQAHHEDYSKPYDVIWLCPLHHSAVHKGVA
jgi:hypothetical protein